MTKGKIQTAKEEALRFLKRVEELEAAMNYNPITYDLYLPPKQSGSVRRASMDLTRALAELRKPE